MGTERQRGEQLIWAARAALQRGQRASARRLLQELLSLDPHNDTAWLLLADVAAPQASVAYAARAVEINPTNEAAREALRRARQRLALARPPANTKITMPAAPLTAQRPAPWLEEAGHFLRRWQNVVALALVSFFITVAAAAPLIAPPPKADALFRTVGKTSDMVPRPPTPAAPLGTLPGQIDVYYTLVWGTREALRFGLVVALATGLFGVLVGASSAYFGGWLNGLTLRITDAFLAFPVLAGVWLFVQLASPPTIWDPPPPFAEWLNRFGLTPLMLTLILFSWMAYARLTNAEVARVQRMDFVEAARAVGAGPLRLIFRHLLPNAVTPALVLAARDIGGMVMLEATFTFIGVGGGSLWGALLVQGRDWIIGPGGNILTYWWVFMPATLMLVLFGIGWNLLGDGLADLLNPHRV